MGGKQIKYGGGGVVGRDIIAEIKMRLPVKSVGRLRCVCKEWLEISSDRKFISKYSKVQGCYIIRNWSQIEVLRINKPPSSSSITVFGRRSVGLMDKYGDGGVKVLHSCNGLVACQCLATPFLLFVCNPTTRERVVVPCPQYPWFSYTYNLAFDPSTSPLHFKIYAITNPYPKHAFRTHQQQRVYRFSSSQGERGWERIYNGICLLSPVENPHSLYWKGKLCWETWRHRRDDERFLLLNDVTKSGLEKFSAMPGPPLETRSMITRVTLELRSGRLICIAKASARPPSKVSFDYSIYGIDDVSSGWSLLHRVDLTSFVPQLYPNTEGVPQLDDYHRLRTYGLYEMEVMSFVTSILDEEGEDDMLVLHIPTKIVAYNLRRRTFSPVWTDQPPYCLDKLLILYRKPLVWPHANLLCSLAQIWHGTLPSETRGEPEGEKINENPYEEEEETKFLSFKADETLMIHI